MNIIKRQQCLFNATKTKIDVLMLIALGVIGCEDNKQ